MKILQLGKFYPIRGGVEKVMWDITNGISARGIDCDMLCAKLGKGEVIRLNPHGRVICVPTLKKVAATMLAPAMIRWLRKHAAEYDIIHIHHPDPMAALALFLSGYKGRVFVHWHSDILKQRLLLFFYRPLQNWVLRRAEKIIGTTPVYVRESPYLKQFQDKVTYVPIGVVPMVPDPAGVEKIRARWPDRKIVFSLGRLVGYKGFEYLVGAAKYLGEGYQIVIGGGGPLKDALNEQIIRENAKKNVSLTGFLRDDEVRNWFGACDVFVLSSIWKTEAFAIVQVEAMSCGKPVVATRIPESGVSWVNGQGESGLNVSPENSKALADAVLEITKDAETYENYSAGARARYERLFTYEEMIDNVLKTYTGL